MYSKILVTMALDHGLAPTMLTLARKLLNEGGEIHALHVTDAPFGLAAATQQEAFVKANLERAADLMKTKLADETDVIPHLVEGHIDRSIIAMATEQQIDCIIMGSHKPDLADYLLGSTAARIVRHAPCAVHVVRS